VKLEIPLRLHLRLRSHTTEKGGVPSAFEEVNQRKKEKKKEGKG